MNESKYIVYVHTNKQNGLRYVGITHYKRPEKRWQGGYGYHKQSCFYNAIKKYGWDGFEHEILASDLSAEEAFQLEEYYIALWKTTKHDGGYNRSTGGESGAKGVARNEAQKAAAGKRMQALWQNADFVERQRLRTIEMNKRPDIRKKRSESRRSRTLSAATRELISKSRKGKGTQPKSEETKAKMREHHAGGTDERPVLCVETGELFESINAAARAKGTNKKGVSGCCRGVKHYNTAGGYHWAFAREEN